MRKVNRVTKPLEMPGIFNLVRGLDLGYFTHRPLLVTCDDRQQKVTEVIIFESFRNTYV